MDGISAFDLKHNFVVSYNYDLPVARLWRPNRLTSGWALSGIARFATGVPVTFASFGDNYLVQVQNNGVNAKSIDMPNYDGTGYKINRDPRGASRSSTIWPSPQMLSERRVTPNAATSTALASTTTTWLSTR